MHFSRHDMYKHTYIICTHMVSIEGQVRSFTVVHLFIVRSFVGSIKVYAPPVCYTPTPPPPFPNHIKIQWKKIKKIFPHKNTEFHQIKKFQFFPKFCSEFFFSQNMWSGSLLEAPIKSFRRLSIGHSWLKTGQWIVTVHSETLPVSEKG